MRQLIDVNQYNQIELLSVLTQAQQIITHPSSVEKILTGRYIAQLFFEPSTRTRCSFEIAARHLGADIINLDIKASSIVKGETEMDTALSLQAMGISGFVIRHKQNGMVQKIAEALGKNIIVLNAGCGTTQHPTQALLDMLTIQQQKEHFDKLTVAFLGDIYHSRVTHSDITALLTLGVGEIRLIAPQILLPDEKWSATVQMTTDIEEGLRNVDVIIVLRIQRERLSENVQVDFTKFHEQYGLTEQRLTLAKPDAIVMHPAPMNRGVEISNAVAEGPQSVILQQVHNGVAIRMAVLQQAFSK